MKIIDPLTGKIRYEKRRHRYNEQGEPRALTFSCFRRYPFFAHERVCDWFREALESGRTTFGIEIWAYVLMPDHVHLLVYPGKAADQMSEFIQAIKQPVAQKAIQFLRKNAPHWLPRLRVVEGKRIRHRFWQPGGGYDRNLECLSSLRAMIEYIHANPVRRGLVPRIEDYEWSSARWFAGISPVRIEMDRQVLIELARS